MKLLYLALVLISALLVAFDLVASELAMRIYSTDPIVMAGIPTFVGGIVLVAYAFRKDRSFFRKYSRSDSLKLVGNIISGVIGVFLTFDSVAKIGASKAMLLGSNTTEAIFIIVLSFFLLKERLSRIEIIGSLIILIGVSSITFNPSSLSFEFGIGEIEIVVASLSYAASVIIATDLLKRVNLTKLVAISAFFQGGILMLFLLLTGTSFQFQTEVWFIIILTGGFSGVAFLMYALGLKCIGAALTSVVYSFVGIFSLILGMLFMAAMPGLTLIFPPSLILSSLGGIIAIFGVYILNRYNGKN